MTYYVWREALKTWHSARSSYPLPRDLTGHLCKQDALGIMAVIVR